MTRTASNRHGRRRRISITVGIESLSRKARVLNTLPSTILCHVGWTEASKDADRGGLSDIARRTMSSKTSIGRSPMLVIA